MIRKQPETLNEKREREITETLNYYLTRLRTALFDDFDITDKEILERIKGASWNILQ